MIMIVVIIAIMMMAIIIVSKGKFTAVKVGIRPTYKAVKYFNVTCINKANLFLAKGMGE